MKKKVIFSLMITGILLINGCQHLKKCDQLYSKDEIPFIYDNNYHDCMDVFKNYAYMVRWGDMEGYLERYPNPNSSHIGETIKVCGYVKHSYGNTVHYKDNWWYCILTDDSISAMNSQDYTGGPIYAQGDHCDLLDSVDFSKKCYMTGHMTFNTPFDFYDSPADPDDCYCLMPFFQVTEIHN